MQDSRESVKQSLPKEVQSIAGFAAKSEEMREIRLYATGHVKSIECELDLQNYATPWCKPMLIDTSSFLYTGCGQLSCIMLPHQSQQILLLQMIML